MNQKFYIAFSVHGTNSFITAVMETKDFQLSKDKKKVKIGKREFDVAQSRRPDYDLKKDGYKLHAQDLLTKDSKPTRSVPMILRFFNNLAKEGWKIDKNHFVYNHYVKP